MTHAATIKIVEALQIQGVNPLVRNTISEGGPDLLFLDGSPIVLGVMADGTAYAIDRRKPAEDAVVLASTIALPPNAEVVSE